MFATYSARRALLVGLGAIVLVAGCTDTRLVRGGPVSATTPSASKEEAPAASSSFESDAAFTPASGCRPLEVHYINVGQGASTLIRGPDGTTLLYDFGDRGDGDDIVAYLRDIGIESGDDIDYAVLSHRHQDHHHGYKDLVDAGIDVRIANLDSRSDTPATNSRVSQRWWVPAQGTHAGTPMAADPGSSLDLGCGATAFVAAANGVLFDGSDIEHATDDENDRSIFFLIRYGDFSMTLDGDMGSGDEYCTDHRTRQAAVQPVIMRALVKAGHVDAAEGVDVLHVAHHGSESSTSAAYYNLARPTIAVASVGIDNDNLDYGHPRASVVETVLLGPNRASCVKAPPVWAFLQTEDGLDDPDVEVQAKTSNEGISAGNIVITTDGVSEFSVRGDNAVAANTNGEFDAGEGFTFALSGMDDMPVDGAFSLGFAAFFDNDDNPRQVDWPAGMQRDATPPAPILSDFDRALLAICGPFGQPVADPHGQLSDLLLAPEHADVLERIRVRLEGAGILMGEGGELADAVATVWTDQAGFQHVFCGERTGSGIGGLHYVGRYLDLQQRGQAGLGSAGTFEVLEGDVYTLPVVAACGSNQCRAPKKGYGLRQSAEDLIVAALEAWFLIGDVPGKQACAFSLPPSTDGSARYAVFVAKQHAIRTFYPVATEPTGMATCGGAALTTASDAAFGPTPEAEERCGE